MNIFIPALYDGYNSFTQTISELSAINAPSRPLWVILGILYTFLLAAFGWGVRKSAAQNRKLFIAGSLLFAYGIIGIGWTFAPMHQREVLAAGGATVTDSIHLLVMSPLSCLFMMASMGFAAAAFANWFRSYSIVTILLLVLFGVLTGLDAPKVEANLPTPWLGVIERIMMGVFLLWVMILALMLLQERKVQLLVSFKKIREAVL